MSNIRGALVTMPHKVVTTELVDELTPTALVAGAANAVLLREDGSLLGDQFDGAGFVRGVLRKGFDAAGQAGAGRRQRRRRVADRGVAGRRRGRAAWGCSTRTRPRRRRWPGGSSEHYPDLEVTTGSKDPQGYDLVVNATPLGMNDDDPLPMDVDRIAPDTFVGEVVMKQEITPFLAAAQDKGCPIQVGTDMLFEQIPAYLEFFGFGTTTADELRAVSQIKN